jgi:subtilisin family serine protease
MLTRRPWAAAAAIAVSACAGAALAPTAAAASGPPPIAGRLARDFQSAWQITRGRGVTVAVLSTGVDGSVQTLAGAVTSGPDYVHLGKPPDITGTLVASMIAGSGPTLASPFGIAGLAPDAHILSVRVFPEDTEPGSAQFFASGRWEKALALGIRYAAAHGAAVIYTNDYGYGVTDALDTAVQYALSRGCVIIGDVGRARSLYPAISYPAGIPGVIGVNSVDLTGKRLARESMASQAVLVSAPGVTTPGTGPGSRLYLWWGDQVATAWAASAAALVKAEYPHLPPALVARAIAVSARGRPPGSYTTGIGYGVVNPAGAIAAAGRLAKLTMAAAPGRGAISGSGHFGAGPPGKISAVRHSPAKLAALSAVTVAGIACLALAVVPGFRWRRRRRLPAAAATPP